jgi:thioredoxin 1
MEDKMNKTYKFIIIFTLLAAVGIVIAIKQNEPVSPSTPLEDSKANISTVADKADIIPEPNKNKAEKPLPRLVDLGAGKCIPCKMMAPILEELKIEYANTFKVEFIDVWENPDEAKKYGIKLIPTQIFYDITGKELFRHEGFFSKEDILTKWQEFGVNIDKK